MNENLYVGLALFQVERAAGNDSFSVNRTKDVWGHQGIELSSEFIRTTSDEDIALLIAERIRKAILDGGIAAIRSRYGYDRS